MVQPTNKRLVTEASVGAHVATSITADGPAKTALSATYVGRRVHVIAGLGQSNMKGDNTYTQSDVTDPAHPRIFQYGAEAKTLAVAVEPLDHVGTAGGLGPLGPIARHYINDLPIDDIVVVVPFALGGTGLMNDTATGWRWGVAGNLSAQAVAAINEAKAAAIAQWPTAQVTIDGVFWVQGEQDGAAGGGFQPEAYRTDYVALINGVRTAVGVPTLPWIAGSMLPERLNTATTAGINAVQASTPYAVAYTGFAPAQWGYDKGDGIHFSAAGQRVQATRLYSEFKRVRSGIGATASDSGTPIPAIGAAVAPAPNLAVNGKVLVKDTFPVDTAEIIGTYPELGGSPWQGLVSRFAVVGGKAVDHASPGNTANWLRVPGKGDYTLALSKVALASNLSPSKTLRFDMHSDNAIPINTLRAEFTQGTNNTGKIVILIAGVATTLVQDSNIIPAGLAVAEYDVTLALNGLTVTLSLDGVQKLTTTLTAPQKAAITNNRYVSMTNVSIWTDFSVDAIQVSVVGSTA